jgi:hypothetical protein
MLEGAPLNEFADILYPPSGDPRTKFDWRWIAAGFDASPPSGFTDRNAGRDGWISVAVTDDLGKPQEPGFWQESHFDRLRSISSEGEFHWPETK